MRIIPFMVHPVAFPAKAERNVVFPAPEGPMTAETRPGNIFPVTHLKRCLCFPFKVRVKSLKATSIVGLFIISVSLAIEITPEKVKFLFCSCKAFSFSIWPYAYLNIWLWVCNSLPFGACFLIFLSPISRLKPSWLSGSSSIAFIIFVRSLLSFFFPFDAGDAWPNGTGDKAASVPGLAWPRPFSGSGRLADFLRENVRENWVCNPIACFLAISFADFHFSRACAVSLTLWTAFSLDFASLLSRVARTWSEQLYIMTRRKLNPAYIDKWWSVTMVVSAIVYKKHADQRLKTMIISIMKYVVWFRKDIYYITKKVSTILSIYCKI